MVDKRKIDDYFQPVNLAGGYGMGKLGDYSSTWWRKNPK